MDDMTNGRQRPPAPEPTPEGRARLLTAIDVERARHPADSGQLGEYVELLDDEGLAAARAAFPAVAAHLAAGCDACNDEVRELRALAALDEPNEDQSASSPRPAGDGRRSAVAPPPRPVGGPADAPSHGVLAGAAQADMTAVAALRRRQRRVLMTGLTAVAAVAMVVMATSLYAIVSLAPRGGTGEIKLIARETLTPASAIAVATATVMASTPTMAPIAAPSTALPPTAAPPAAPATTAASTSPGPSGTGSQPKPAPVGASTGPGSAAPSGTDCPDSHPVKANRESGIYHLRDGAFYDRTRPEVCYASPEDAERAGYRRSQR